MTVVGIAGSRGNVKRVVLPSLPAWSSSSAARIALVRFDSYLGSYLWRKAWSRFPGQLIEADSYYAFFIGFLLYRSHRAAAQRPQQQPEYGSLRTGRSRVFIDDREFASGQDSRPLLPS
jgi:hypothetical protein